MSENKEAGKPPADAKQPVGHPVALEKVVFTTVAVHAIPEFDPERPDNPIVVPENNLNVARVEDQPGMWLCTMRTVINPAQEPKWPYSIIIECIAAFRANEAFPSEEVTKASLITGNSVLYGAIRETVAMLTSRQPYGALILGLSVLQPKPNEQPEKKTK